MAAAGADPRSAIAPITCDTTGTREKALASLLEQIMDSYSVSDDWPTPWRRSCGRSRT